MGAAEKKNSDGAPRFAPAGDRPLVGSAAGLAGTPENSTPFQMPQWSDARLRELADAEPGGLMACSPELLAEFKEMAKTDPAVAATLERAGVKAEVGHGTEERDQRATQTGGYSRAKGSHPGTPQASAQPGDSEGGADSRGFMVGGNRVQDTSGSDGTGDLGTPVVKTQKSQNEILNDLAWGEMQDGLYNNGAEEPPPEEPHDRSMCQIQDCRQCKAIYEQERRRYRRTER